MRYVKEIVVGIIVALMGLLLFLVGCDESEADIQSITKGSFGRIIRPVWDDASHDQGYPWQRIHWTRHDFHLTVRYEDGTGVPGFKPETSSVAYGPHVVWDGHHSLPVKATDKQGHGLVSQRFTGFSTGVVGMAVFQSINMPYYPETIYILSSYAKPQTGDLCPFAAVRTASPKQLVNESYHDWWLECYHNPESCAPWEPESTDDDGDPNAIEIVVYHDPGIPPTQAVELPTPTLDGFVTGIECQYVVQDANDYAPTSLVRAQPAWLDGPVESSDPNLYLPLKYPESLPDKQLYRFRAVLTLAHDVQGPLRAHTTAVLRSLAPSGQVMDYLPIRLNLKLIMGNLVAVESQDFVPIMWTAGNRVDGDWYPDSWFRTKGEHGGIAYISVLGDGKVDVMLTPLTLDDLARSWLRDLWTDGWVHALADKNHDGHVNYLDNHF